jgi:eukaryotic-like serine/threonine-protein kinase
MPPANGHSSLKFGPFIVDLRAGEVRKNGTRIRLQEKPLRVLVQLAEQQGEIVSREELKKNLWPDDTFVDFETGLNTAVKKLRGALSDDAENPRFVETLPRRGYRFIFPIEFVPSDGTEVAAATPTGPTLPANETVLAARIEDVVASKPERKIWSWRLLAGVISAVALGAAGVWFFEGRAALSFNSHDSVLVADFENQTGDPRFDTALNTAFTVSIEQSRYANVYPRTLLNAALARMGKPANERITPVLGREISVRENVRGLLTCSITRTGQEYEVTAQLIDPRTGATVRSYTERSHGEDHILEALDVLSKEMREALGESLYQIQRANRPLPEVTTKSLSALQQYAEGTALWNRGKHDEGLGLLKAAVASDPDFAMAHAAIGGAFYSYIFNAPEEGQKEYEKALSLATRTTDRERMIIETRYAQDQKHTFDAAKLFGGYLARYPDDAAMRFDYANLLRGNQSEADAVEQYKEVLRGAPDFAHAYLGMATAYKMMRRYPEALQAYSKAFEIEPALLPSGNAAREYGFTLVANGQGEKAEEVFRGLLANPESRERGLRSLAFLDLYYGRYANAERKLEDSLNILKGQKSPLSEGRVRLLLAIVAEGRGDTKKQRQYLDAAFVQLKEVQLKTVFGALLGDAYARAGCADQAEQIDALIKPQVDTRSSEQMGYLNLLEGDMALATGQKDKAIELLKVSEKDNGTALSLESLAHAYQKTGDVDESITLYQDFLSSVHSPLGWEPQQRWLEAHVVLASAYLSRGEKQKAQETLGVFPDLWKNADADLVMLQKAHQLQKSIQAAN